MHIAIGDAIVAAVEAGDDDAQGWFVAVAGQRAKAEDVIAERFQISNRSFPTITRPEKWVRAASSHI